MFRKLESDFVWDPHKEMVNIQRHNIDFTTASQVFRDPQRKVFIDAQHSQKEKRFWIYISHFRKDQKKICM